MSLTWAQRKLAEQDLEILGLGFDKNGEPNTSWKNRNDRWHEEHEPQISYAPLFAIGIALFIIAAQTWFHYKGWQ